MKREELKDILQNSYSQVKWIKTLQFLSGSKNLLTISLEPKFVEIKSAKAKEIVVEVVQLGTLKTTDGITLPIFDVTLQNGIKIEYNRVGVNELLKTHILKDAVKGAIVTFHYPVIASNEVKSEWRFSFISKFGSDYFAEAESIETNPKKYTYIFGTSEEHRTALERLYNLEQSRFRLEDFFEAFNVEPVSNNFFKEYKNFYQDFVFHISNDKNSRAIFEQEKSDDIEKDIRNFVKRLLGRLVFLYFLQKKHWLGASSKNYDNGDTNFLFNLFNYDNDSKDHFYNKWLSKLFFNALNTPNRTNDSFELPNGTSVWIPFLNGGLFEEHQEPERHREIQFPPTLFELLFKFFNGYNFTIYENSPEDHTVAVDPEMLGHIFENLLEDNKDKGAFYTPKEIVHYMTQESLIEYLKTHLSHSREAIESLIKNHSTAAFTREDLKKVEKLIDTVKICDPAIGSGAFPMGLLQEIFALKAVIHYEMGYNVWSPAKIKQDIIQNSIYGVDLEEGAVDIARLRFWLSLVVDEPTPKPLPNLDYKIMQGNSLLESYDGVDLSKVSYGNDLIVLEQLDTDLFGNLKDDQMKITVGKTGLVEKIQNLINLYFTTNTEDKPKIKSKINNAINEHIDYNLDLRKQQLTRQIAELKNTTLNAKQQKALDIFEVALDKLNQTKNNLVNQQDKDEKPYFLWQLFFANVFKNGGFDIVIGNPPYIQMKWLNDKSSIENSNFETFSKTGDVYCVFYELANIILKEKGNAVYITSNKWLRAEYGKNLREYFIKNTNPLKLIDFKGYKVFETATVDTNIILWKKEKYKRQTETLGIENDFNKTISLSDYFNKSNKIINFDFNDQWIVLNSNELRIKELVENNKRLSELNFELNYGILTGANPVFIINSKTYNDLLSKDENNFNIIKPILRGKDLIRYGFEFSQFYLINSHTGIKDKNILPIDIPNDYPVIKKYFEDFGEEFKNRGEQGLNWFNLRSCSYIDYFEQPKIIYADIVQDRGKFYYDEEKFYTNDTAFIISGEGIKPLTALLNSSLVSYIYKTFYSGGGLGDKGIRFKKEFLSKVPISKRFNEEFMSLFVDVLQYLKNNKTGQINDVVKNDHIASFFEEVIDGCVFELYFEEHMKEKGINIIDDVKKYIDASGLNQDFKNINEGVKKQKIWELYKTLKESTVNDRMRQFVAKSPDILKPILQA
jgi:hypothetical protein